MRLKKVCWAGSFLPSRRSNRVGRRVTPFRLGRRGGADAARRQTPAYVSGCSSARPKRAALSPGGEHVQDHLVEHVELRAGRVTFVLDGEERTLAAGEQLTVVPGTWHRWWMPARTRCGSAFASSRRCASRRRSSSSGDSAPMGTRTPRGPLAAVRCAACHPLSPGAPLSAAARCRSKAPVPAARRARAATGPGAHSRSLPRSRGAPRRRIGARSPPGAGDAADRRASVRRA
jgi:hypothetical protein